MPKQESQEDKLKTALADCVLGSSYWFCGVGVALAVPLGVRLKSYSPIVYLGLGGTLLDLLNGYYNCKAERQALEDYQASMSAAQQQSGGR